MKRFSFSLHKLLSYKEQVLSAEQLVLADMNAVLAALQKALALMLAERAERTDELDRLVTCGTTVVELNAHKNYLNSLDRRIEQKKGQVLLQAQAVSRQMDKVREAKVEVSAIEKLREKRLDEYNYELSKAEEQLIEEFVGNTRAASMAGLS